MFDVIASVIGNKATIPDWPTNDLQGLFDALARWKLDTRLDFSGLPESVGGPGVAPFRNRAWGSCVGHYSEQLHRMVYTATKPIHPDRPNAVRYFGNFIGYSFGFWLDTDDSSLIQELDEAILLNILAQEPAT